MDALVNSVSGVYFNCSDGRRKEYIREWAQEMEAWAAGFDDEETDLLVVTLDQCGSSVAYRTVDDIPLEDVPCPCGNPDHWLIRWRGHEHKKTDS